jgi:SCY1-like protein 3
MKLYRHPFILRYVDYCESVDSIYLFTEKVSPLSVVLKQQSNLQVCLGLQNVIQVQITLHMYFYTA